MQKLHFYPFELEKALNLLPLPVYLQKHKKPKPLLFKAFYSFSKKNLVVTSTKWQTEALPWFKNRAAENNNSSCSFALFIWPEIRATHLAHSSLQNGIKATLWSISVAGNFLFPDFFVETVDFVCQGQEVAEAEGWDTAGEQLVTVGRTEEWSAGRNHTRNQELQIPALPRWSPKFCSEGWNTFTMLRILDTSISGYFSTKPYSRARIFLFHLRGFQKLKFPEIPPGLNISLHVQWEHRLSTSPPWAMQLCSFSTHKVVFTLGICSQG